MKLGTNRKAVDLPVKGSKSPGSVFNTVCTVEVSSAGAEIGIISKIL